MRQITAIIIAALSAACLTACAAGKEAGKTEGADYFETVAETASESANVKKMAALPAQVKDYMTLTESYIDDIAFEFAPPEQTEALSHMLNGHYDVTGRTGDDGKLAYYMAVRRDDAPVYEDFDCVSAASVGDSDEEILQIGYCDREGEEQILYRLEGYDILSLVSGIESLDVFCFGTDSLFEEETDPKIRYAFDESGREQLDFLKKWPGLSLYREGQEGIRFYYQDKDTIQFYSEPYPCFIPWEEEAVGKARALLEDSQLLRQEESPGAAWETLRKLDSSIYNEGVTLYLDGFTCHFFGRSEYDRGDGAVKEQPGYMLVSRTGDSDAQIQSNPALYALVMAQIQEIMSEESRNFDTEWFQIPLASAAMEFPGMVEEAGGSIQREVRSQRITEKEKLEALSGLMDRTLHEGRVFLLSGCPYTAVLEFVREDGERLRVFAASDSCDSMAYEGRIALEYGDQAELAAIFDEAMKQ